METAVKDIKSVLSYFLKHKTIFSNYDADADVLYLHFKKTSQVDDSELAEDDIIIRYENDEIVGFTILNASKQMTH